MVRKLQELLFPVADRFVRHFLKGEDLPVFFYLIYVSERSGPDQFLIFKFAHHIT